VGEAEHLMIHDAAVPEIDQSHELRDRFAKVVSALAVTTTFVAALVAWQLAAAGDNGDAARLMAQRLGIQSSGVEARTQLVAQAQYESFLLAEIEAHRASDAFQHSLVAPTGSTIKTRWDLESHRWSAIAEKTRQLSGVDLSGPNGPLQDPEFPNRFLSASGAASFRLDALREQANHQSAGWQRNRGLYSAVLAILALTLYLFTQGLSLRRARLAFAWSALGLLAIAVSLAVWTRLHPPAVPSPMASDAFAKGHAAMLAADYPDALRYLNAALKADGSLAQAHVDRATVSFLMNSSQSEGFVGVTVPAVVPGLVSDLEAARDLGLTNAHVLGELGFYLFLQGLQEHRPDLLGESVATTRQALKAEREAVGSAESINPVYEYNLAVATLASGAGDASAIYREAICLTIYLDECRNGTLRANPVLEELWVGGALTDLETVGQYRPELRDQVEAMKAFLVGAVSGQSLASMPPSTATANDIRMEFYPDRIQVSGVKLSDFGPKDVASTQWYFNQGFGWGVIPSISGQPLLKDSSAPGRYFDLETLFTKAPPMGLPAQTGEYRVEIYVNGRLAGSQQRRWNGEDIRFAYDPAMRIGFGRAPDWTIAPDAVPGAETGYASRDGESGVYIFRLELPLRVGSLRRGGLLSELWISEIADLLSKEHVLPARPVFAGVASGTFNYFKDLTGPRTEWWRYSGGLAKLGAGMDGSGHVVVGVVFGPRAAFNGFYAPGNRIFDSFVAVPG
jgi:tetratricopeptide (TPR) repeat protein